MFSLLSRILRRAHRHPWAILFFSLGVTLLCIYPISKLRWELSILDTLPGNYPTKIANDAVEKKFGGFGTLTVVINSPDSAKNDRVVKSLSKKLENDSLINFIEFETETEFYKQNKLLYIQTADLALIRERGRQLLDRYKLESNPLLVNLLEDDATADSVTRSLQDSLSFEDLENKYLKRFRNFYSNTKGTIRIVDIYPSKNISDLNASRKLTGHVSHAIQSIPEISSVNIQYTGKVYHAVSAGRTLLPEAKKAGKISAVFFILVLLLRFFKQPQIIFLAAAPITMSVIWTMGVAELLYGRINLFTLMLALILPGLACQQTTHIMSRYADERKKGLSPTLSLESAMLGIGPSITVSAFICAATFFSLISVPLAGMHELGILGAVGSLLNWGLCCLVLPALLLVTQKRKPFILFEKRVVKFTDFKARPYQGYKRLWIPLILITVILALRGIFPVFDYNFAHTELQSSSFKADSLLKETDYPHYDPVVVLLPDAKSSVTFYNTINQSIKNNPETLIRSVTTYANLLPSHQKEKMEMVKEIRAELNPEFVQHLNSKDSANIEKIISSWNISPISEEDLPSSFRHKFEGRDGTIGEFAFIFPSIDINDGLACRRFAKEIRNIDFPNGKKYLITGTAIIRADLLDLTLPHLHKPLIAGGALLLILTLLFYNRLSSAIFTLASPCLAMVWLLSLTRLLGIEISAYSALAFPLLIGMSVDGSIQLWNAYYEKSTGSLHYIMHTTGVTVGIAQGATLIGIYSLLASSHPGIKSIGEISILGLLCITVSHLLVFPLIAGYLDSRRFRVRKKD